MTAPYLTVRAFALQWLVNPSTVRRWIAQGKVEAVRTPTGQWRVRAKQPA